MESTIVLFRKTVSLWKIRVIRARFTARNIYDPGYEETLAKNTQEIKKIAYVAAMNRN